MSSVIRQKGESQNGCFKKTKYVKFSEKRTFLETPVLRFAFLPYCRLSSGLRSNVSTIFPDLSLRFTIFTLRTLKFKKNSFWVLLANDDGLIRQLSNNRPIACGKFTLKSSDLVYMVLSSITFVCL